MSNIDVFVWFQYKHYDENCNFHNNNYMVVWLHNYSAVDTLYTVRFREVSGLNSFKNFKNQTAGCRDIAYCLVEFFLLWGTLYMQTKFGGNWLRIPPVYVFPSWWLWSICLHLFNFHHFWPPTTSLMACIFPVNDAVIHSDVTEILYDFMDLALKCLFASNLSTSLGFWLTVL